MSARSKILNVGAASARADRTELLRAAGYEVLEASSLRQALTSIRAESPDLVLSDATLEDATCADVVHQVRSELAGRPLPIVCISGDSLPTADGLTRSSDAPDIELGDSLQPGVLETVVGVMLQLRRSQIGLRETESRWQRLVDSNVVGIVVVEDGRLVEANGMFQAMVGCTGEDFRRGAFTLWDLTPSEYHGVTQRAAAEVLSTGSCAPFEKQYLRKDGSRVDVVVSAALIDRRQRRWMALITDVSEQKRVESERAQAFERERIARSQAEDATRVKDEFLANLSHELRTPMNVIIGWAHLLRKGALSEPQRVRAAEAIERAARSQAQLIEDLLDVSRIVTGKFRLQMQAVRLGPVLISAVENLRVVASAKQIVMTLSDESAAANVRGDPDRLQQVFLNLLSNAVKFTPANGCVDVRLARSDEQLTATVSDTGVGISGDFLPHVFDRFRQADSTSSRAHSGMGLGLAIVRHVVELHGGKVRADSLGPDRGATFTVTLPLLRGEVEPAVTGLGMLPAAIRPAPHWRILLVDDDPDAREVTVAGLEKAGHEIRAAASAQQALGWLDSWHPDLIVSDIGMPGLDGYEFMQILRARPPERGGQVPALALTAFARLEDVARARASGFQGHLAKPVSPEDLAAAVHRLTQLAESAS